MPKKIKRKTTKAMKPTPKTQAILEFLKNEGYRPEIDEEGLVQFKKEGETFLCYPYEDDAHYVQLAHPLVCVLSTDEEKQKALWAINEVSRTYKLLKLTLSDDTVGACVELLLHPVAFITEALPRAIAVLASADRTFNEAFRKSPDPAPTSAPTR
ncbi:MAG: hypothetical protein K8T26_19630 [Lentisphaerae bacterium]|nr:hypothetical protein [Lentisphaerota bacterium]